MRSRLWSCLSVILRKAAQFQTLPGNYSKRWLCGNRGKGRGRGQIMADPKGFLKYGRELPLRRSVEERKHDWIEVYLEFPDDKLKQQAARCMDCGIPFCHQGCPLGNIIPDWND